jgi:deazaflavin-dependent oxidoreductase (nitroreductase family)
VSDRSRRIAGLTNRSAKRRRTAVLWSRLHARVYSATGGRLMRGWFGAPVIVLETVGRRSGLRRTVPVIGLRDGPDLVVLAAAAGSDRTPAWWLNLSAAGEATAVVRGRRDRVTPRVSAGPERAALWARYLALYPAARHYPDFTKRELPLVVLERAGDDDALG